MTEICPRSFYWRIQDFFYRGHMVGGGGAIRTKVHNSFIRWAPSLIAGAPVLASWREGGGAGKGPFRGECRGHLRSSEN